MPRFLRFGCATALLLVLLHAPAASAQFAVSPLRLQLGGAQRDTELVLTNESDRPLHLQARVVSWTQDASGRDVMSEAADVVLFPRIMEVAAGEARTIRIAMRGALDDGESAYRVYVEELPSQAPADAPLRFTLQVSVPLFVHDGSETPALEIRGARVVGGQLLVDVANAGSRFARLDEVVAVGVDAQGRELFEREIPGWYLLAGVDREFAAPLGPEECGAVQSVGVVVREETSELERRLPLTEIDCEAATEARRP